MLDYIVKNEKGQVIRLNALEQRKADTLQKIVNALGYEIPITTLTTIMKKISMQKFYEIPFADYLPVRVGEGAWSTNLVTYRSFNQADDFSTGLINTGANNDRLAFANASVDSLPIKVNNWAKQIGWTIFDLEQAAKAGNWDLITAKETARKKNWDLGVQKIAFLGLAGDSGTLGLLNQSGITTNTLLIPQFISTLSTVDLKVFLSQALVAYRQNCNFTAWPTHFVMPELDYLGLAAPASSDFPIRSTLDLMLETFKVMTQNPNFKILPLAYANKANNPLGLNIYTFLNYDEESIRMDIPVDYTNTLANSIDNFSFQNVGYGQVTGALAYRPAELLYFTNAA